jgi:acyl-[acyl-carrier-protein]-phospholipid O-acyltransferase/long-chain-fatty-acid--[acyl-carrier-protein] ligase
VAHPMLALVTQPGLELLDLAAAAGLLAALAAVAWFVPAVVFAPFLWLAVRALYRIRVIGRENVPATGPALLVCNHVSYIDWLLIRETCPRPVRFVVWAQWSQHWLLRRLITYSRAIPIDGTAGPRAIVEALRAAGEALKAGEVVCIFAEGRLSRNGFMFPFHRGFEQIVKRSPAPVLPVCLDNVWGSIFSYRGGKVFGKWPQRWPLPITVAFGPPAPHGTSAAEVRLMIQALSAEAAKTDDRIAPVHRAFIRTVAKQPNRPCLIDTAGEKPRVLTYAEALTAAACLAHWLRPKVGDARMVGVWLPSSVGGALANIAVALLGKASVNLNYTAGRDAVASAVRQCGLKTVVSSKKFRQKMAWEGEGVEVIDLEDAFAQITKGQRARTYLMVRYLPGWLVERLLGVTGHRLDELMTIIFSSGSTGEPKGVMLTHRNIAGNAASCVQGLDLRTDDVLVGCLPFFHSFGYTVTLWMPLQVGASTVYHADPRQAKEIGELTRHWKGTLMVATPTFLRFYLRRAGADDFKSLRLLICGAEKLPMPLADEFEAKFGVRPLEGYGCTELSPVVSTNVPDLELDGQRQIGQKKGSIGQPLPGVACRIVDPESYATLKPGQEGLLLVTGANVMSGYLDKPAMTAKAVHEGWYVTGDMGRIDEDGFVVLTGRLSRFAKVAGEMVPLERVEEELHRVLETTERLLAVTSVPDEKRGERLVVLHLPWPEGWSAKRAADALGGRGLPNLWLPGERDFYPIEEMPVLGSGKLDLKRLRDLALERAGGG